MNISIESVSNVVQLKPGHKYLLILKGVTQDQADQVLQVMRAAGVECVGVGLDDGENVEIVEVASEQ